MSLPADFNEKFNRLIEDVQGIKENVKETKGTLKEMVEGMKKLKEENILLKKKIAKLEEEKDATIRRLNEAEQYSRKNNVIITGLPREPRENLREKVTKVAEKLNVKLYEYDICAAHRLSNKGEAPAVIIKMNNREKKTQMIRESKKREIKTRDVGYATNDRIFLSEHLTKETTELLQATKEKLKEPGFVKFVWPSEGHILIRENEGSRIERIQDMEHLHEIENAFRGDKGEDEESDSNGEEPEGTVNQNAAAPTSTGSKEEETTKKKTNRTSKQQTPITRYMPPRRHIQRKQYR
jgi:hypothetical protein